MKKTMGKDIYLCTSELKFLEDSTTKTLGRTKYPILAKYWLTENLFSVTVYSMRGYINTALRLANGMGYKYGTHIVINTKKFYVPEFDTPITMYSVRDTFKSRDGTYEDVELFKTTSMIQVVLFMRDLFYGLSGQEIPVSDDEKWNKARAKNDVDTVIEQMKVKYRADELQDGKV